MLPVFQTRFGFEQMSLLAPEDAAPDAPCPDPAWPDAPETAPADPVPLEGPDVPEPDAGCATDPLADPEPVTGDPVDDTAPLVDPDALAEPEPPDAPELPVAMELPLSAPPSVPDEEHPPPLARANPNVLNETTINSFRSMNSLLQSQGSVRVNGPMRARKDSRNVIPRQGVRTYQVLQSGFERRRPRPVSSRGGGLPNSPLRHHSAEGDMSDHQPAVEASPCDTPQRAQSVVQSRPQGRWPGVPGALSVLRGLSALAAFGLACTPPANKAANPPSQEAALVVPPASSARSQLEVAITVDDLPIHGPTLPGQTRLAIHEAFLSAIRAHRVPPVYGFVCAGPLDGHPEDEAALKAWVAAGNLLGNHTRTHPDIYKVTVGDYLADLDGDESLLRKLSPGVDERVWKVFRYPYLQEGTDLRSRASLRGDILARGYRIAEVTIDFYDWAYNDPFVRCALKRDDAAVTALKTSYLDYADGALHWADATARALIGRPIEQILLLHMGAFDALVLDDLLTRYEAQGVRFVSLDRAMADPAYALEPRRPVAWEGTFLSQVSESRDKGSLPEPVLPEALLSALCR